MGLTQGAGERMELTASDYKKQIANLLDMIANDDLKFLNQIAIMMKTHIAKRPERKGTHHEE